MQHRTALISLLALAFRLVAARVCHNCDDIPSNMRDFDFIVVGGGTAGSVVASRISEERKFNVLLIEAGPDNEGILDLTVPSRWLSEIPSTYKWNYTTVPQPGFLDRVIPYDRGHVLGGSSSINAMVYSRGSADDYDRWARLTGDDGWKWDKLLPLIKRHEKWVPPAGGRDVTGQFDPKVHGFNGNTRVSLPWSGPNAFDAKALEAVRTGKEFDYSLDQNSGNPLGLAWIQSTIGNGERSSAATAYLSSSIRDRPNLTILTNTRVTRVLRTGSGSGLDIRTVEFASQDGGRRSTLTAKKEIILSSGVFGSPQILQNSGIGDRSDLTRVGVPIVHHLPDVGKNMADHVTSVALWQSSETPAPPMDPTVALNMWESNRTGPLTEATGHQILWARIPSNAGVFKKFSDPAAGRNTAHLEVALTSFGDLVGAFIVLLTPHSRGTVKIRSNNPIDAPLIDPNWLSHDFDIQALVEGYRVAKRFYSAPAWNGYILAPATPDPDTIPIADYHKFLRESTGTTSHACGTAAMSARNAKHGVVDPDLRVKGVKGIRVVDASVFPFIPSSTLQAPVYILAERAADLIKRAW